MAKTPVVLIHSGAGASLDSFYEAIRADLNAKYHNYQSRFPDWPMADSEHGQHASGAARAAHAGDGLIVNGNMASIDGGKSWVNLERLVR